MKLLTIAFIAAHLATEVLGRGFRAHRDTDDFGDGPRENFGPFNEYNRPTLELPNGKFEAVSRREGVWTFKNIPYAAPPVGDLRWEKPRPPKEGKAEQNKTANPYQVWMDKMETAERYPEKLNEEYSPDGTPNGFNLGTFDNILVDNPEFEEGEKYGEDCLTLDVLVPESALLNRFSKIPVVVFIYGGAFISGGKEKSVPFLPLYDGLGLLEEADGDVIYVVFNYRVGAFGFLGGTTTEKQAVPNVGLWDQRAVFQWVQDYIHLVGGDPGEVTAMGHSAGASSIMFHLTAEGGTLDPLFKYAIMLSPAYIPVWDRDGHVEDRFKEFESLAGCKDLGFECLRTRSSEQLQHANQEVALREVSSSYAYGPVPDGTYIRQLPMLEWAQGNIWPIEKVIMTHTSMETENAVNVDTSAHGWSFSYLANLLPHRDVEQGWVDKILEAYPFWSPLGQHWSHDAERYQSELHRMQNIVLHSCFTCHMRWFIEAIGRERVYLAYYSVYPYVHGADMLALFWQRRLAKDILKTVIPGVVHDALGKPITETIHGFVGAAMVDYVFDAYKRWMLDFMVNKGDTSVGYQVASGHPVFGSPEGDDAQLVKNVLGVALKDTDWNDRPREPKCFYTTEIGTMPKSKCDFWMDFYSQLSEKGNYTVSA